jgi:hypothetical protein
MRNLAIIVIAAAVGLIGFGQTERSDAAFHIMRVYGVLGGAGGDTDIQYVELRMAAAGQNFVATHDLCFFDASGAPYARFTFPSMVSNGANGASILTATSEFDAAWAAGSPDFVFSGANSVAIAGGADVNHPMRSPAGKVAFGSDSATVAANMCAGSFAVIDSISYGTGYSGTVDFGTKFNTDMPSANTDTVRLQGPVCFPPSCTRDNSTDYSLTDVNVAGEHPRNNSGDTGPISLPSDSDGDGVPDSSDNCPSWPNPGQSVPTWYTPPADPDNDCDGFSNIIEGVVGTDSDKACGHSTDGAPSENWPGDLNGSDNINIADVLGLKAPFGQSVPPASARFDLAGGGTINIADVLAIKPVFGGTCTP